MTSDQGLPDDRLARRAAAVSLAVSFALLLLKFWAYRETRSQAVFSDAMETIVNVAASGLALVVLAIAYKPADQDHPYGHGKVEFFSAAFEGGLIAFASVMICIQAVLAFFRGVHVESLGFGFLITIASGVVNALLGVYLLHVGRRHKSEALEASGRHVLSDFWTTAGVTIGLVLVHYTGIQWFDPAAALIVGLALGWTGIRLVRRSAGGLLDEEDKETLGSLEKLINQRPPDIIHIHHLRVMRSGRFHHIDAHCVVPEFWDVSEAHERTEKFEAELMRSYTHPGELHLHVDPCRRAYCRFCAVENCPIRREPFVKRRELSLEELTSPEEPQQFIADRRERT